MISKWIKSWGKILICRKQFFFLHNSEMGQIIPKTVLLLKMTHIQLNYSLLLFWRFSPEIDKNFSLRFKKIISQKEANNYRESYFFSTSLKTGKFWGIFLIWWERVFGVEPVKRNNITENSFAPQNKPHPAKLRFSGVWKHFHQKLTKQSSSRSEKRQSLKEAMNYQKSFFF